MTRYVADFSLSLINRTGAYYVCRDLVRGLPQAFSSVRYWRMSSASEPPELPRKVLGRAMMYELTRFQRALPDRGAPKDPVVFMDPLYVLKTPLRASDVVLCHDLGPITHVDLFEPRTVALYRQAYAKIAAAKPGMVFVSAASRDAFIAHYGADYPSLDVIPLYVRAAVEHGEERAPPGLKAPFLLMVGAFETRKNHTRAVEAFIASGLRDKGYTFAMCGPRGNAAHLQDALAATPGVQLFGYLSDAELLWLYRNASAFILPSLLEGFGVPALEAARHNLLSLISAGGAQEEAVGSGAILVDPLSVDSIAAGMRSIETMDSAARDALIAKARAHADMLTLDRYLNLWAERLGVSR